MRSSFPSPWRPARTCDGQLHRPDLRRSYLSHEGLSQRRAGCRVGGTAGGCSEPKSDRFNPSESPRLSACPSTKPSRPRGRPAHSSRPHASLGASDGRRGRPPVLRQAESGPCQLGRHGPLRIMPRRPALARRAQRTSTRHRRPTPCSDRPVGAVVRAWRPASSRPVANRLADSKWSGSTSKRHPGSPLASACRASRPSSSSSATASPSPARSGHCRPTGCCRGRARSSTPRPPDRPTATSTAPKRDRAAELPCALRLACHRRSAHLARGGELPLPSRRGARPLRWRWTLAARRTA
jgi:hypothetical protein